MFGHSSSVMTRLHYDCSKLDQWCIVMDHATSNGLYLHFKMQENEMDDDRRGHESKPGRVPESLDGGKLGSQRKALLPRIDCDDSVISSH